MELLFWSCLIFVLYTYAGYPLLLSLLAAFSKRKVLKGSILPTISVVMTAHNEEKTINARIENLLSQQYPKEMLEVIVVSDGSTDRTEELVRSFMDKRIKLLASGSKMGKAAALNSGIASAKGEFIVFADARQTFKLDVIRQLVVNFNDSTVGCVSGELLFLADPESEIHEEMGAYWRYEKWIRKMESQTGSVVGATGAIYAIRSKLFKPLPHGTILDDVLTPMNVVLQGYRTIFDGDAVAYDIVSKDVVQERRRKVRTLAGNWQLLGLAPALLNPFINPLWWRFLSHKIARLIIPFALLLTLCSGTILDHLFYRLFTLGELIFYSMAAIGALFPVMRKIRVVNLSYFFIVMNHAAVIGFWRWLTGRCQSSWQPAYGMGKEMG